jgi:hyperosmotically inducible protein
MRSSCGRMMWAVGLAVVLCGCNRSNTETTSAPAGGPPPGGPPGGTAPAGAPGGAPATAGRTPAAAGSDGVMSLKVKNQLITSKVDTRNVNVDTKNGVVTLNGSVPTAAQKSLAEKVAKQVHGVSVVKDNLTVGAAK